MIYSTQWLLAASFLLPMMTVQTEPAPRAAWAVRPTTAPPIAPPRPALSAGTPSSSGLAEAVRQVWVTRYAGNGAATDMTVDAAGNVVVTGISYSTSREDYGYVTVKYSASGQQLWAARFDGAAFNRAAKVVVDTRGNVYVSGTGTGSGNGSNREDFVTFKYSASGTLLWSTRFDGGGGRRRRDYAADVAVDATGNVYVTGTTDPGGIGPSDYGEVVTVKYSPTGQPLWTTFFPAFSNNFHQAVAIALDRAGEVLVSGFDRASVGYLTYKYAGASGRQLWQSRTEGPFPAALAVDAAGDAYVTGRGRGTDGSADYTTVKYAGTSGQPLWQAHYEGPDQALDQATALVLDGAGNVVVTGTSNADYVTLKYAGGSGQPLWQARYPGNGTAQGSSLTTDAAGNVYVTGSSSTEAATVKYAPNGQQLWEARYAGLSPTRSGAVGVALDAAGHVYVAGTTALGGGTYFALQYAQTSDTPPAFVVPDPIRALAAPGECSASVAFAATSTSTPGPILTYALPSEPITSPHLFPVGVSTVTVTASSSTGTQTQSFSVTVVDTEPPTLAAPPDITFPTDAGTCDASPVIPPPAATDRCGPVSVSGTRSDSRAVWAFYPIGTTTITWTATDEAGNSALTTQLVHVRDETAPMVRTQDLTVALVNGRATVTAEQVDNGSRDPCGFAAMTLSRTEFTAADLGPNRVTLTVTDRSGNSASANAVVTVLPAAPTGGPARYRLHAGGGQVTTSLGAFAADQYAAGGAVFSTDQPIAGTDDEALYQTERYGSFTYHLPVPNGQYTVKLHFAEIYWNSPGQRVFDVAAEGTTLLRSYDIVQKAGPLTATTETFPVTVADGQLTLAFYPGAAGVDQPKVSAIEVLDVVPTAVFRLKAGAEALTTSFGHFAADQYAAGGAPFATTAAIAGTEDDALYQSERYGTFAYNLPVPNGTYTVKLHFAELYWNAPGQRVFNVAAENTTVLQAYDIVQKVGPLTATTESFAVTVRDGVLSLAFVPGADGVDQPKVSAIEVLSGGSALPVPAARPVVSPLAAPAAAKLPDYSAQVKLYPNPSADGRITVELPATFQGEVTYTLLSSLGTTLSQGQRTVSGAGQSLTFDFSPQLAAEGLYYLHLRGAKGQAHVKLLRK